MAENVERQSNEMPKADALRHAANEILRCQAEIAGIREKMNGIKAEYVRPHMKMAEFNVALRYHKLDDDDIRLESLENLKTAFLALSVGEQGDFFASAA